MIRFLLMVVFCTIAGHATAIIAKSDGKELDWLFICAAGLGVALLWQTIVTLYDYFMYYVWHKEHLKQPPSDPS